MTLTLHCSFGEHLVIASGCVAETMPPEKKSALAASRNWSADPDVCPRCQGKEPVALKPSKGKDQS